MTYTDHTTTTASGLRGVCDECGTPVASVNYFMDRDPSIVLAPCGHSTGIDLVPIEET